MRTRIKNAFLNQIKTIGLPILALCWVSFFWGTTWIASKEGVKHMPALQLAAIRQFIGGGSLYKLLFVEKNTMAERKTMEIHFDFECAEFRFK